MSLKKTIKTAITIILLPTALVMSSSVLAKNKKYPYEDSTIEVPTMLSYIEGSGGEILAKFKVNDHLNGFAVTINNDRLIVYATADGQYVFNGSLLDSKAEDLTQKMAKKFLPKVDTVSQVARMEESSYLVTHKKGANRKMYVLHDPNCPYCKVAHETVMSNPQAKVEVRWIPVGALGKNSAEKAAMLLSNNSMQLQDDYNKGYQLTSSEAAKAEDKMQEVINNTRLMKFLGISGTPAFIIVDDGVITDVIQGNRQGDILKALGV